jgi:dolichol-phosphate mannosyltransferase
MTTWIVIPTYNEIENLQALTEALLLLPIRDLKLLFVDDASPDGTGRLADELGKKTHNRIVCLHRKGKRGLGTAYIAGFRYALDHGATIIGQMDADFSHPIDKIPIMIRMLDECDVAVGSRYIPGGKLDERWSVFRKFLSTFGNIYSRTILGLPIKDVTGGFRFWRKETLKGMPLERVRSNGYVFQVEMAYLAHKIKYRFKETPIYFADRRWGKSKMSLRIQLEAAFRVWGLIGQYKDL